ncbi:MAG: ribosomal-processing cysteine protease Prp [Candidatus Xenobiia bacterium LiM19]
MTGRMRALSRFFPGTGSCSRALESLNSVSIDLETAMITITVTKNRNGVIKGFCARGHAGQAEEGSDVVCAAVTVLMEAALQGLTEIEMLKLDYSVVKNMFGESLVEFQIPELSRGYQAARVNFLMATVYASLKRIEERYSEYIRIEEVFPQSCKNKGEN